MRDQAEMLRKRLIKVKEKTQAKAIAVISGKGGVGKSNFSLNFALSLSRKGRKVLLFDMDIGMGNIDILMGLSPKYTIVDMLEEKFPIDRIIEKGPEQLSYIAGGTGLGDLFQMDRIKLAHFINQLDAISNRYDYLIFDMGAGVTEDSLHVILSAQEVFLITTPEPTSMTDAYASVKYVSSRDPDATFFVLVNRVMTRRDGVQTQERLIHAVKHFLKKEVRPLGTLPDDKAMQKAVIHQTPILIYNPGSKFSHSIEDITERYLNGEVEGQERRFIDRLKRHFFERKR